MRLHATPAGIPPQPLDSATQSPSHDPQFHAAHADLRALARREGCPCQVPPPVSSDASVIHTGPWCPTRVARLLSGRRRRQLPPHKKRLCAPFMRRAAVLTRTAPQAPQTRTPWPHRRRPWPHRRTSRHRPLPVAGVRMGAAQAAPRAAWAPLPAVLGRGSLVSHPTARACRRRWTGLETGRAAQCSAAHMMARGSWSSPPRATAPHRRPRCPPPRQDVSARHRPRSPCCYSSYPRARGAPHSSAQRPTPRRSRPARCPPAPYPPPWPPRTLRRGAHRRRRLSATAAVGSSRPLPAHLPRP